MDSPDGLLANITKSQQPTLHFADVRNVTTRLDPFLRAVMMLRLRRATQNVAERAQNLRTLKI